MKKRDGDKTKREEMTTYQVLALSREFKSKVRREKAAARGVNRIVGGDDPSRPYLKVSSQRYREVRAEVTKEFLEQVRRQKIALPGETILQQLRPAIDRRTYDRLAAEQELEMRLEALTVQGRQLTKTERACLREAGQAVTETRPHFSGYRSELLDEVMTKVVRRQRHNPTRYQTAWAETVGGDLAQQTRVERVDEKEGVLYFRCLNSVVSHHLQRLPDLPKKLTKALGFFVRKVAAAR